MANYVNFKDISQLSQKSTLAGTEKIPISDTEYITPNQIGGSVSVPTISTNVQTDKASDTKTSSPKSVYEEVHPAVVSSEPAGGMLPNICYEYGTLSSDTTFALDSTNIDSNIANIYYWIFSTSSTAPTITFPNDITAWVGNCLSNGAPVIAASKRYEISVKDGVAFIIES